MGVKVLTSVQLPLQSEHCSILDKSDTTLNYIIVQLHFMSDYMLSVKTE